jgi:type II secretory pathway pseudopilin PulG
MATVRSGEPRITRVARVQGERGITVIELLVATAVFALFIIIVDAVFFSANRSAKKTELAAEVQQNARIAVERLTREIRESGTDVNTEIRVDSSMPGESAIVFKSARLPADNAVFCVYVRTSTEPLYNGDCFTFPGGNVPAPNYTSPEPILPRGTYTPIWQRYVGYYVVDTPDGLHELRRVTAQLNTTDAVLPVPLTLTGGDVIATMVESFDVTLTGGEFRITLKSKGSQVVQGVAVPDQEIVLPGTVLIRN